ncbi:Hypothetical protein, putative [Bodo saltans]|uniref:Sfi1 spindle body domain-containing protein n=1 Tax=Bodo saltans TaxID=75058 RepID=A0A0S4JSK0_BODSA|nr:Hypothetical protein, putative [Bodo saltans]|eukprot:CUG93794.1 Hypothetical protein, putative [Bodo saltans]
MSSLQSKFYRVHTVGRCVAHWRRSTTLSMTFGSSAISAQDVRAQKLKRLAFSVWMSSHKDAIASRVYQARLFSQWRVKSSHVIEHRVHCAAADTLRIAQTLRSCFSHWRHQWDTMCPIKAEVDYVIAQWRLRRSFRQWSRRCAVVQHDRCLVEDILERKNQSRLTMLWAKWKNRSILHRAEREFRSRRRVLRLHSLVGTWRERVWLIDALRNQALADALELHQWQLRRAVLRSWKKRLLLRIVDAHETRQREMNVAADHHKRFAVLRRTMQFWYGASIAAAAAAHSSTTTRPISKGHGTTSHIVDTSHPDNTAGAPLGGSYQSYRSTVGQTRRHPRQQHSDVNHSFPDGDDLLPHTEQSFFRPKPASVSLVMAHHHPVSNLTLARARLHGINGGFVSSERNSIKRSPSAPWGTTHDHNSSRYGRTQPALRSNNSHQEYDNDNVSGVEVDDDAEYLQSRGPDDEHTPARRHSFRQDHRAHLPPQSHDAVVDPLALFEEADDAIEVLLDDEDVSFLR